MSSFQQSVYQLNIKLPENYTYILNAFNERLNIIQENIDYCNRELQKLIL